MDSDIYSEKAKTKYGYKSPDDRRKLQGSYRYYYVGFVPVTNRLRSDAHTVTALCHSESEVRSDEEGNKLSRRRLQLPLILSRRRESRSQCPATDFTWWSSLKDCLSTV
ncbi:hypothetical protein AVEN_169738-1 [Araneus ventricosus]|uniref:Uncharacterized protein n=1 Tax=Araneus ventricosus TaxID=182803 RepID=A0A4Y2KT31_ARAVE|nr:hypothetical protein AVEN_169738-1 [Araneus ventricosus]